MTNQGFTEDEDWEEFEASQDDGLKEARHALAFTQAGMAHQFAQNNTGELRSVPEKGQWLHWDRSHWEPDALGHATQRLYTWLLERYQIALAAIPEVEAAALRKFPEEHEETQRSEYVAKSSAMGIVKFIKAQMNRGGLQSILTVAATNPAIRVAVEELDTHPDLLATPRVTVDLRTGKELDPNPNHLLTKCTTPSYVSTARAPRWEQFLDEVTQGDTDLQEYLQRMAGYILTGHISEHLMWVLVGPGRNGKDVFADTLSHVLGTMAGPGAPRLLIQTKHDEHPTEIADLQGQRLVVHSEIEQGAHMKQAQVKLLTASQTLKGRAMRQDFTTFRNVSKHLMLTNYLPALRGDDLAMRERIKVVPFTRVFSLEERDLELPEKLQKEAAGILAWMVQGAIAWHSGRMSLEPAAVTKATAAYFLDHDPGGHFVEEMLEVTGNSDDWMPNPQLDLLTNAWVREQVDTFEEQQSLLTRTRQTRGATMTREGATLLPHPRRLNAEAQERWSRARARGWTGVKAANGWEQFNPADLAKLERF